MEQIMSSSLVVLLFWAAVGVIALVAVVWLLRWVFGVDEILKALQAIRDELQIIRRQQITARPSSATKPDATKADAPHTEPSHLDIPEDWHLGRSDKP